MRCAHTATVPTNSTKEASAAASSKNIFSMIASLIPGNARKAWLEHMQNNVLYLFFGQDIWLRARGNNLNEGLTGWPSPK